MAERQDKYTPLNHLIKDRKEEWTFTHINIPYTEIAKRGIVLWCVDNLEGRWTMVGGNKFAFEESMDATLFKIQFGLAQE